MNSKCQLHLLNVKRGISSTIDLYIVSLVPLALSFSKNINFIVNPVFQIQIVWEVTIYELRKVIGLQKKNLICKMITKMLLFINVEKTQKVVNLKILIINVKKDTQDLNVPLVITLHSFSKQVLIFVKSVISRDLSGTSLQLQQLFIYL